MKHLRQYIVKIISEGQNRDYKYIADAIHSYTSLSQDRGPLNGLLGSAELKSFMLEMQNQIPSGKMWASRKLNFRDRYIADEYYIEEGRGEEIELKGPVSFYFGESPTEFENNKYQLNIRIPREKIIFHSQYHNFGIKSEREILTESMTIVVTSVVTYDDWEGNQFGARVTAKVIR